jgi:hypothetical protein
MENAVRTVAFYHIYKLFRAHRLKNRNKWREIFCFGFSDLIWMNFLLQFLKTFFLQCFTVHIKNKRHKINRERCTYRGFLSSIIYKQLLSRRLKNKVSVNKMESFRFF